MQEIITGADILTIKVLLGIIVGSTAILGYFFRDIHKMVKKNDKLLNKIFVEHNIFHKGQTGIKEE
jgi:hypothetical protein